MTFRQNSHTRDKFCTIGKVGTNVVASVYSENGTVLAYMDEATSALDNITQKVVTESLSSLNLQTL